MLGVVLEHAAKSSNAASSQGVHRTSTDGVDADIVGTKIVGQISDTGLEGGFGHAHDIVVGYNFFGPIVGHGHNAAAVLH